MDSYDSDSSDDESAFTGTNVLLGYASKESTDDSVSHLGGIPRWIDETTLPPGNLAKCKLCSDILSLYIELNGDLPDRFAGHDRRLYILGCRRKTCRRKEGSIRGFRAVRSSKAVKPQEMDKKVSEKTLVPPIVSEPRKDLGSSLFGIDSRNSNNGPTNPFSSTSNNPFSSQSNPFAGVSSLASKSPQQPDEGTLVNSSQPQTSQVVEEVQTNSTNDLTQSFADKVRLSPPETSNPSTSTTDPIIPVESWPGESSMNPYPLFHLEAEYESLSDAPPSIPDQKVTIDPTSMEIDEQPESSARSDGEDFESNMDRTFQRFADRVGQNPEQVLRYEFGGEALLYSHDDGVGRLFSTSQKNGIDGKISTIVNSTHADINKKKIKIRKCENCKSDRVFEFQLMPHAISILEDEDGNEIDGMDWGTIIFYVCENDCLPTSSKVGQVKYMEEWIGVQWEEQNV